MTNYEVEPYETFNVPDTRFSVYHDGDEESNIILDPDASLRLGETSGQWQIKLLPLPEDFPS